MVEDEAAASACAVDERTLGRVRVDPVLVAACCCHRSSLPLGCLLVLDVLLHGIERRTADRGNEIGVCPERRQLRCQPIELLPKHPRRSPLDGLHGLVDAELRVYLQEQVDMVGHDFHFEAIDMDILTRFTNQLLQPRVNAVDQNLPAIFWAEYDVVLARVCDVVVRFIFHASIILQITT